MEHCLKLVLLFWFIINIPLIKQNFINKDGDGERRSPLQFVSW